jgi:hypothetical protein
MTDQEVFNKITSTPKWYAGYISPQYATNIKRKFKDGTLPFVTMEKLFNHFGYYMNYSWRRKQETIYSSYKADKKL